MSDEHDHQDAIPENANEEDQSEHDRNQIRFGPQFVRLVRHLLQCGLSCIGRVRQQPCFCRHLRRGQVAKWRRFGGGHCVDDQLKGVRRADHFHHVGACDRPNLRVDPF